MSTHQQSSHLSSIRGFTLIELLVTLAILWVIFGFAVPSFNKMIQKTRSDALQQTVYSAYQSARTIAVSEGVNITICGSDDGENCALAWSNSIIIFADQNQSRSAEADELKLSITLATKTQLRSRIALGRAYTIFTPTGTATYTGSILVCPEINSFNHARRITWNNVGRVYVGRDHDNDGIIDDTNGAPLVCDT